MTQFGSHNWSDYSISVDAMLVKDQPLDGFADVPTVAALMPCQFGAQDQFDLSSTGVVSQNGTTCLSSKNSQHWRSVNLSSSRGDRELQ